MDTTKFNKVKSMTEHCVIDGERCSKCCEVITLNLGKNSLDWIKYIRRYGYPDDWTESNKLFHRIREISKRRAKKLNPRLTKAIKSTQRYFTCINSTGSGCSDYENRPNTCSEFPHYGRVEKEFKETPDYKIGGLYHIACTFYE